MYNVKEILKKIENEKIYFDGEDITCLLVEFGDYSDGYIDDIITYVCDNNIDIYDYNLWEWARENEHYINQAVLNYGIDSKNFDLMKLFQSVQYEFYNEAIYNNLSDFIYYAILKNIDAEEVDDNILEEIENISNKKYSNERLDIYIERINDIIKEEEEDDL